MIGPQIDWTNVSQRASQMLDGMRNGAFVLDPTRLTGSQADNRAMLYSANSAQTPRSAALAPGPIASAAPGAAGAGLQSAFAPPAASGAMTMASGAGAPMSGGAPQAQSSVGRSMGIPSSAMSMFGMADPLADSYANWNYIGDSFNTFSGGGDSGPQKAAQQYEWVEDKPSTYAMPPDIMQKLMALFGGGDQSGAPVSG